MRKTKSKKGITLIALVITIIMLLILAGISIALLTNTGLFGKAQNAKSVSRYSNAKETINLKLMEIETGCYTNNKEYNIKEIANEMKKADNITIEKYYNDEIASIKNGVTENITNLTGLVVSVDEYNEYKFLLGKECNIEGVTSKEVTDTTDKKEFKDINQFEKDIFGEKIESNNNDNDPKKETLQIPDINEDIDTTKPIEITTYMSVKCNTKNTLKLNNIENIKFTIENKTNNIELQQNVLIANNKANSEDSCKIKIEGTYQGQSYINHLTVYVEPQNITTVKDENGIEHQAFAVYNEKDLVRIQELVNNNVNSKCNVKLMNNINLNENLYTIGEKNKVTFKDGAKEYDSIGSTDNPYSGIFDGNGKEISGLLIKKNNKKTNGFFGMISKTGVVKNLTIKNSVFNGDRTGTITGYNEGKIYRCKAKIVTIEDNNQVCWNGGIVGVNNGEITECIVDGYLYGGCLGGIAGANGSDDSRDGFKHNTTTGKIYRCYTKGYIGYSQVGSIVSHSGVYGGEGYIYDCFSTAEMSDNYYSGAIVAVQSYQGRGGYIYNSYYLNKNCNFSSVVTSSYYGNVTNSYANDTTINASKLNRDTGNTWIDDTNNINGGYPILRWMTE